MEEIGLRHACNWEEECVAEVKVSPGKEVARVRISVVRKCVE